MNSIKIVLSKFKKTYMLLMDYPYIRGEYLTYYSKKATWKLLNAYVDSHSKRIINEYPGYGVQAITVLKYKSANMTFSY